MTYKVLRVGQGDLGYLLDMVENDLTMLKSMIKLFLEEFPQQLAKISEAIEAGNAEDLSMSAHLLKGAIGNFHAPTLFDQARQLQLAGDRRQMDNTGQMFQTFKLDMNSFHQALLTWLAED